MADLIKLLPDGVVNQIAAGEVIQRPASVVKELLDNAIDSGGTEIRLSVREAGKSLIMVTDNGCGMSPTDARMAFERHATSKIRSADDLFAIRTMGFRGEALASIAAVAEVEIRTRRHEDTVGTRIQVSDSRVRIQEPCACLPGTQVTVQELFYTVPARKKFLKSDSVELRHIHDEFVAQAIAHPEIAWSYTQGENEMYRLQPSGLRQRIIGVFGKKYQEELISLDQDTEIIRISGFIGSPSIARRSRGEQLLYVNRRLIKNHYLNHAISSAYEELIAPGNYPFYALFIEIDPNLIDINVHPTKHEIKFDDERLIYNFLQVSVKHALGRSTLAPRLDFENANPGLDQIFDKKPASPPTIPQKPSASLASWRDLAFPQADRETVRQREETIFSGTGEQNYAPLYREDSFASGGCYQFYDSFIFLPARSALMFIDQQAAHERILYESYLKTMTEGKGLSQKSLFPQTLHLSKPDVPLMMNLIPHLNSIGFEIEEFGSDSFIIHASPALLESKFNEAELIKSALEQFRNNLEFQLSPMENAARSLARSSSIRRGRTLSQEEMSLLVEQLFLCETPHLSPDGKKTIYQMKLTDFLKNFHAL
jgi:DNA mismatch repair protein MutL